MILHHRNVLMGGGVEDDLGPGGDAVGECFFGIGYVVQPHASREMGMISGNLAINLEKRVFGTLHEEEFARLEAGSDAREFRADGTARSGDEHPLASDGSANGGFVNFDGRAIEELNDIDFEHGARSDPVDLILESGDESVGDFEASEVGTDSFNCVGHDRGNGDDHHIGALAFDNGVEVVNVAEDGDSGCRDVSGFALIFLMEEDGSDDSGGGVAEHG